MGLLINGRWYKEDHDRDPSTGQFLLKKSIFRNWITSNEGADFKPEKNRYHLYVSLACPWAHRTIIYRKLKGLESIISMSVTDAFFGDDGWTFAADSSPVQKATMLHQIYTASSPDYTGRVTVPVLWDKKNNTIVNNESSDIIRMFNSAFDEIGANSVNFLPTNLLSQIDEMNEYIHKHVNDAVYQAGFATKQSIYDKAVDNLFAALNNIESILAKQRYLLGSGITEADWRLFVTLVRFDWVYYGLFKCNKKRISEYKHLWDYLKDLYQQQGIAQTVDLEHIKHHYYTSIDFVNPSRVIAAGCELNLDEPHTRNNMPACNA